MVHGTPLPAKLVGPPLSDREAIADACYRAFLSIDQCNEELLKSAVTEDVYTDIADKVCNGYDELRNKVWTNVSNRLDTVHYLTNMRISIDTETTARVTFSAMHVHCVLGKGYEQEVPKFTTGALYDCEAVRVEDAWKLSVMVSSHVWATGERSIMRPPQ
ncbi:hypothetical protein BDV12DRAFT_175041 [Aspergillus spectabilis]